MRATLSLILVLVLGAGALAHNGEVPPSPPPNIIPGPDVNLPTPDGNRRPDPNTNPNRPTRPPRPNRPDRPGRPNTGRIGPEDPLYGTSSADWTNWWSQNRERFLGLKVLIQARIASARTGASPHFFGEGGAKNVTGEREREARNEIFTALLKAATDRNSDLSTSALVALGKTGDARAVETMVKLGDDMKRDKTVREAALLGLGLIGSSDSGIRIYLTGVLENEKRDSRERAFAALGLGFLGNSGSIPILMERARTPERRNDLPAASILALGLLGDEIVVADLTRALSGPPERREQDDMLRMYIAAALGRLGSRAAIPALSRALLDREKEVRRQAVLSLGGLVRPEDGKMVKLLLKVLTTDRDSVTRGFAAVSLGEIGADSAADALLYTYRKGDSVEVPFAALGLGILARASGKAAVVEKIGGFLRGQLKASGNSAERRVLAIAVGLAGDRSAVPILLKILSSGGDAELRGYAAIALGLIGDERAAKDLRAVLDGKGDHILQRKAAIALARIGDPAAVDALFKLLREGKSQFARGSAAMALSFGLHPIQAKPLVEVLANEGEPDAIRTLAALALGRIAEDRPLPSLARLGERLNTVQKLDAISEALSIF